MSAPLKILLVGNGNEKHRGERYYDPCKKLYNGLVRGRHNVYFLSDRDITRRYTPLGLRSVGMARCNRYFLDVCARFRPQMIMFYHADIIHPETIAQARAMLPDARIAQFNVDIIFNPHNVEQIRRNLDVVDATFITTAGAGLRKFSRPGKIVSFVPNLVDASIEWPRAFERSDQPGDVFWALRALSGSVKNDRRIDYPLFLEKNGVNVDYYGMNGKPLLYDARYFEAINACKMGLNISQIWTRGCYEKAAEEDLYLYSSDRIAHLMGSGLLTLTTRDHHLEELFEEDREMVFFADGHELLDKVRYYLAHDDARRAIAQAGWTKYHTCFNERLVAQYMVERTMGAPLSQPYAWPTECW